MKMRGDNFKKITDALITVIAASLTLATSLFSFLTVAVRAFRSEVSAFYIMCREKESVKSRSMQGGPPCAKA